ncbi:PspA/IM30 family protein [Rhizobium sp. TH2]|uniref:PspA/IM30 family protein n=1 Tax=Rhizobium sp. TH2 TaxID=2775403 RepID=UPI002157C839|nr:PspA/IM30 family protein [Rhizobium sp. TH2]UVC08363.1 PspA/IM30 family protein [Rhizobium sp. TH2]
MFKQILTLLRGRAFEAEQDFLDQNAIPLLGQQIRDATLAIQSARRAVAIAIAQNEQEVGQHKAALARITDLETRAIAALQQGNEKLAREAAEAIGWLEAECAASEKAQAQFSASINRMKSVVRASEARLRELQRGERLARATEHTQKLDRSAGHHGLATLSEAEETLLRLRTRQQEIDTTASALREMDAGTDPAAIIEKLAKAGCGAPLQPDPENILARLRARMNNAA